MSEVARGVYAVSDEALGNTSYLIDVGAGAALAVDPRRDVDEHLQIAKQAGLRIVGVLETHLHADFVGGARELARAAGATIYAAEDARLAFDHRAVPGGQRITFESAEVEVIATPGHTPEHVSYLVRTPSVAVVFSGGSLIVGGAARTDLTGDGRTEELARAQFASVQRIAALPDDTLLCPTHGGGSFCSTGHARSAWSAIGEQRTSNPLFSITDEDRFVEHLRDGFGSYPRYFAHLRDVNRTGAALLSELAPPREVRAVDARAAVERGAWLIDARSVEEWARAHADGSISIALRPSFASWLGWVVPFGAPVVLILDAHQLHEAVRLALRIGYDGIEGWLPFQAWEAAELPVASIDVVDAAEAAQGSSVMVDVRQRREFAAEHIAGAIHLELGDVIAGKTPDAGDVITYCSHGERSATAASILVRRGVRVVNLRGGIDAWHRAGLPVEH